MALCRMAAGFITCCGDRLMPLMSWLHPLPQSIAHAS
jgi:hypothetical protein